MFLSISAPGISAYQYAGAVTEKLKVAQRAAIPPFYVMEVVRQATELEEAGASIVHLEVGQPATAAPKGVIEAAHHALDNHRLGYATPPGEMALRTAIAEHHHAWYDHRIDPGQVSVTVGASGACVLAFLISFDPGDRVVVPSPGYPCYRNMLAAFGIEVVDLPLDESTRFQPTAELLSDLVDRTGPVQGLVVASPSNPTGTMLSSAAMASLATWCDAHAVRLISDEIYHGLTFGEPAATAAAHSSNAIVVNSFSKYFSMTGWRLGWLVLPPELAEPVAQLGANLLIAPPTLSQLAAVAAFECHEELQGNVHRYRENRAILLDGLPAVGLDRLAPADGAFYLYAKVDHVTEDSQDLCQEWLRDWGVAATPGIDFDRTNGHQFVRFSFAGSPAEMHLALERLGNWHAARALG